MIPSSGESVGQGGAGGVCGSDPASIVGKRLRGIHFALLNSPRDIDCCRQRAQIAHHLPCRNATLNPSSKTRVTLPGILRNYNTIEDFKNAEKSALLDQVADQVGPYVVPCSMNHIMTFVLVDLGSYLLRYNCRSNRRGT